MMKTVKLLYSGTMFMLLASTVSLKAQMINKSTLYISAETVMSIQSDVTNDVNGLVHNEGMIVVNGSLTNNADYDGEGTIEMGDADTYTTLHLAGDTVATLILSESHYTELTHDILVTDSIIFNGGDLLLTGNTLCLADTVGFRNHSSTNHITTNSGKILLVNFDNPDGMEIPLSYDPDLGYTPLTISNSGSVDHFYIEMTNIPTDDGTRSGTASSSTDIVNAMWIVSDSLNANYSVDLNLAWSADEEGSSFDNTNTGIATYENSSWDLNSSALGNASSRTLSKTGITALNATAFAIGDAESDFISGLLFALKVYLEGPYNSSNSNMNNGLNAIIPTSASDAAAYGSSHSYSGAESFVTAPATAVDWVLVELRDAATASAASSSTTVATVAGLLLQDGSIVAADGTSNISFEGATISNNAYIVVRHRNHMALMSSSAVTQTNGVYTYDFSNAQSKAYNNALKEIVSGVWGMYGGDIVPNNDINAGDNSIWTSQKDIIGQYLAGDVTMNADVNAADISVWTDNKDVIIGLP